MSAAGDRYRSIWHHMGAIAFEQQWIEAGGVRTRCVTAGPAGAPAIVLLHGMGGTWEAFCANIPAYAERYRVLALDMLGCGYTDKPIQPIYAIADYVDHLEAVFDVLAIADANVVGVSLGSWIAARLALRTPARVRRIAMCAPSGLVRDQPSGGAVGAKLKDERLKAVRDPSWENVEAVFHDLIHDPANRIADLIDVRRRTYLLPDAVAAMERVLAITPNEAYARSAISDDEWRTLTQPVLVIESVDDNPHFRRNADRLAALLPHVERARMSQVAHWPQFEQPDAFNALTTAFFDQQ